MPWPRTNPAMFLSERANSLVCSRQEKAAIRIICLVQTTFRGVFCYRAGPGQTWPCSFQREQTHSFAPGRISRKSIYNGLSTDDIQRRLLLTGWPVTNLVMFYLERANSLVCSRQDKASISTIGLVQKTFRVDGLAQEKPGHVPFRESKLTRLLQVGKVRNQYIMGLVQTTFRGVFC